MDHINSCWTFKRVLKALLITFGALSATEIGAADSQPQLPPKVYVLLYVRRPPEFINLEHYGHTQRDYVTSRPVLHFALQDPLVADLKSVREQQRPEDWLEKEIRVEFLDQTRVLKVSLKAGKPRDQAIILNAIAAALQPVEQETIRKHLLQESDLWIKVISSNRASLGQREALITQEELQRLPPQINRDEYVKTIGKDIVNLKVAIAKDEKQLKLVHKMLQVFPRIQVIELAEVPAAPK